MGHFPYLPMLAIFASLVSQEIVMYNIFSYNGFMIAHLGAVDDKDKAGYYSGLLTSSFMIGRFLTSYFWGWFADRYGRRKVILVGLLSATALSVAFGVSWTFWWAFLMRFLLGALNGSEAVSKVLVSEICGKEHEIVGMGCLTTAWSIGMVMGPGLGGLLVEPATRFPSVFPQSGIFGRFPFLLPNLAVAGLSLLALPLVLLFVPGYQRPPASSKRDDNESLEDLGLINFNADTLIQQLSISPSLGLGCGQPQYGSLDGSKKIDRPGDVITKEASSSLNPSSPKAPSRAPKQQTLLPTSTGAENGGNLSPGSRAPAAVQKQSNVRVLLFIYFIYSFLYAGFEDVFSLWALSSVASGGLNWPAQRIGQVLLATGVSVLIFEPLAIPCITSRIGIKVSQRLGSLVEVPVYVMFPMIATLRGTKLLDLASAILLVTVYTCSNAFYIAISLAINNSTDASRRGEINGQAMMINSIGMAAGPIVCSVIFAFSVDAERPFPFDVHLMWYTAAILRFVVGILGWNTIRDDLGQSDSNVTLELDELDKISVTGPNDPKIVL
ncbi:unnamed protein product [Ascophyllum nodosum]